MKRHLSLRGALLLLVALSQYGIAAARPHARDPFQAPAFIAAGIVSAGAPAASAAPVTGAMAAPTPALAELQLRAVIFGTTGSLANINGHIVGVGESVDEYQVVDIGPRSVLLRHGARRLTLTINQKETR